MGNVQGLSRQFKFVTFGLIRSEIGHSSYVQGNWILHMPMDSCNVKEHFYVDEVIYKMRM